MKILLSNLKTNKNMTVEEFVKQNLPNYGERKANLYRIHRNKSLLKWCCEKFPEAWQNFYKNNLNELYRSEYE